MRKKKSVGAKSLNDPDDAPELTDAYFKRADVYSGRKLVRRGRPPSADPKVSISIRIDSEVVRKFKKTGPGWQSRINEILKRASGRL